MSQTIIKIRHLETFAVAAVKRVYEDGRVDYGKVVARRGHRWGKPGFGFSRNQVIRFVDKASEINDVLVS